MKEQELLEGIQLRISCRKTDLQSEDYVHSHFQGYLGWGSHTFDKATQHSTAGLTAGSWMQGSVNLQDLSDASVFGC